MSYYYEYPQSKFLFGLKNKKNRYSQKKYIHVIVSQCTFQKKKVEGRRFCVLVSISTKSKEVPFIFILILAKQSNTKYTIHVHVL